MKLFGIGIGSDKRKAKALPSLLAQLFSGKEGEEVIVDASDAAIEQINAAEQRLVEMNEAASGATDQQERVEELEAENERLTAENARLTTENGTLSAENVRLGNEAAGTHTSSGAQSDAVDTGEQKELKGYKKTEAEARAKAEKRLKATKGETK